MLALAAAAVLVIARSAVFLLWEQSSYDSDQAVFGLMAKHIVEGRALPMFIYGQDYMFALESWLAAPLFAFFGPSATLLKLPVVAVNVAVAVLLVWLMIRDAGLGPLTALTASAFFVAAPPVTAKMLVESNGGNPEPFLYVLLLWMLRHRPIAFGAVFAMGFIQREFTVYGVTAIIALAVLDDRRVSIERLKSVALAAIGYLVVSQAARTLFVFSTPFGPGTSVGQVSGAGGTLAALTSRYCWAPASILPSMTSLFGDYLGVPFGATDHRMVDFGMRTLLPMGVPGVPRFWPLLGVIFAAALIRVIWIAVRDRRPIWGRPGAVATFLLLIGVQSGVAYALARCGRLEPDTFRYALLMVYVGVGVVALYFVYETHRLWRGAMVAVMIVWTTTSVVSHLLLWDEYLHRQPPAPHRALATYLLDHDIRYARSDYWTAYATTFLAGEKVIVASNDTVRITSYQDQAAAHAKEAVIIQRQPCTNDGVEAVPGNYWVCAPR